ncbi:MAG: right-handed parallel beta-helix repeat-containing protein, partial [Nanoarchaeota archaeon]|nr:right-handed parallel beta-helix repeat-containing protein [Nanoarchaeota archaeon]
MTAKTSLGGIGKIFLIFILVLTLFFLFSTAQENPAITAVLEYKSGTQWDPDDDGVEFLPDGIIDLTVENTQFNYSFDDSDLCTKWEIESLDTNDKAYECHGAESCCNFINMVPTLEQWDAPFQIFYGKLGATENNNISAQVIYLSIENISVDYSEKVSLPARFIDPEALEFSIATNKVAYMLGEQVVFDVTASDYLDYKITVSKDGNDYQLLGGSNVFAPQEIGNYSVYAEGQISTLVKNATTAFEVVPMIGTFVHTDKEAYVFGESVSISVDIANYEKIDVYQVIDSEFFKVFETDKRYHTFIPSGPGKYAVTAYGYIGGEPIDQTIYFDVLIDLEVRARISLEDLFENTVPATISCYEAKEDGKEINNNNNKFTLNYGEKYDLIIEPEEGPVFSIEIHEFNIYDDKNLTIRFDPIVSLYGLEADEWEQMYAIDLSDFNTTFATLGIDSSDSGDTVYRCEEWNLDTKVCEGNWTLYQEYYQPGYTAIVSGDDVAFGEKSEEEMIVPDVQFETFGSPLLENFTIYREQPDGVGTNRSVPVDFVFVNHGNSTLKDVTLFEPLPDRWNLTAPDAALLENTMVVSLGDVSANSYVIYSYELIAPPEEGIAFFNESFVNYVEQNTDYTRNISGWSIRVNDTKAFFDVQIEFVDANDTRTAEDTITLNFNVTNIGNHAVTDYPTEFYWQYNDSLVFVEPEDITGDCPDKAIVDFEDLKAIKCEWPVYYIDQTRYFSASITAITNGTFYSKINITYDPPAGGAANLTFEKVTAAAIVKKYVGADASAPSKDILGNVKRFLGSGKTLLKYLALKPADIAGLYDATKPGGAVIDIQTEIAEIVQMQDLASQLSEETLSAQKDLQPKEAVESITEPIAVPEQTSRIASTVADILGLPRMKKGKRAYLNDLQPQQEISEIVPDVVPDVVSEIVSAPAVIWITTQKSYYFQTIANKELMLLFSDAFTREFEVRGSVQPQFTGWKELSLDDTLEFVHPVHGKRLKLKAKFGTGAPDLFGLRIRADHYRTVIDSRNVAGLDEPYTMYVPNTLNSGIYICPRANELSEVNPGCVNKSVFSFEEAQAGTIKGGMTVSLEGGYYKINGVTGTGSAQSGETSLIIWDDSDPEGGGQGKTINQTVHFYINFSNLTSGAPITGASCNITFNVSPTGPNVTYYDSNLKLYRFNRTFENFGNISWNVTCNTSTEGYVNLTATDHIDINNCTVLVDNLLFNGTIYLCPNSYTFTDSGNDGVVRITASTGNNSILDCAGANITRGSASSVGRFISKASGTPLVHNLTVRNCNIQLYSYGMYLYTAINNITIEDSTFYNSYYEDIYFYNLQGNHTIQRNIFNRTTTPINQRGMVRSDYNTVDGMNIYDNVFHASGTLPDYLYSLYLEGDDSDIVNNTFHLDDYGDYGIYLLSGPDRHNIDRNTFNLNSQAQYAIYSNSVSDDTNVTNNIVNFNYQYSYGITLNGGNRYNITNNTITNTTPFTNPTMYAYSGLSLTNVYNATVTDNTIIMPGGTSASAYALLILNGVRDSNITRNTLYCNKINGQCFPMYMAMSTTTVGNNITHMNLTKYNPSTTYPGIYFSTTVFFENYFDNTTTINGTAPTFYYNLSNTVIQNKQFNSDQGKLTNQGEVYLMGGDNITFRNCTFDTNLYGLSAAGTSNLTVENCSFQSTDGTTWGIYGSRLYTWPSKVYVNMQDLTLRNNTNFDSVNTGEDFYIDYLDRCEVYDNTFSRASNQGTGFRSAAGTIIDCNFFNNTFNKVSYGIYFGAAGTRINIDNNLFENISVNGHYNIRVGASTDLNVTNNIINANSASALSYGFYQAGVCTNCLVEYNNFNQIGSGLYSSATGSTDTITIRNNNITGSNSASLGVYVVGSSPTTNYPDVYNNTIVNFPSTGDAVRLGGGVAHVHDNIIANSTVCISLEGTTASTTLFNNVYNNTISGCTNYAIDTNNIVYGRWNNITRDNIIDGRTDRLYWYFKEDNQLFENFELNETNLTNLGQFVIMDSDNITIRNTTLHGGQRGRTAGMIMDTVNGFYIDNNNITNVSTGIYIDDCNNGMIRNNTINEVDFVTAPTTMMEHGIDGYDNDNVTVDNNNFTNIDDYGIDFPTNSDDNTITNNNFYMIGQTGIYLVGAASTADANILNNNLTNIGYYGIYHSGDRANISNNIIHTTTWANINTYVALYIAAGDGIYVENNDILGAGRGVYSGATATNRGNYYYNNTIQDMNATSNNNYRYGFRLYYNYDSEVINNTIINAGDGILIDRNSAPNYINISGNVIKNGTHPYYADGSGIQFISSLSDYSYVYNNTIEDNEQAAIWMVSGAQWNYVFNNTFCRNAMGVGNVSGSNFVHNNTFCLEEIFPAADETSNTTLTVSFQPSNTPLSSNRTSCTVYVDGNNEGSNSTSYNNLDTPISISSILTHGSHLLNISCQDNMNNTATIQHTFNAVGQEPVTCDTNFNRSYTFANSLNHSTGTCVYVNSSNIVIDCNGFNITGGSIGAGINSTDRENVTIKNCYIYNFTYGILLQGTNDSEVEFSVLSSNTVNLLIDPSYNNTIANSTFANGESGIILDNANETLIHNNTIANHTLRGINITSSWNNTIKNNTIYNNTIGLDIVSGSLNFIYYNNFSNGTTPFEAFANEASGSSGNSFNISISGAAQGNYWDDIVYKLLDIYDTDGDGFGDSGTNYPYNNSNSGNVTGIVVDYGPIVTANANMSVSDNGPINETETGSFEAIYTNVSNSQFITGATCEINFSDGTTNAMTEIGSVYQYNKTFSVNTTTNITYNVSCLHSQYTKQISYNNLITVWATPEEFGKYTNFTIVEWLGSDTVYDVSIYDLTEDTLDYNTWFNDSTKSWWLEANRTIKNSAFDLDGSGDYLQVPFNGTLNVSDSFAIEAWIKPGTVSAAYRAILEKGTGATDRYFLYAYSDEVLFGYDMSSGYFLTTSANLKVGQWYHIVGQHNQSDGNWSIYVNGSLEVVSSGHTAGPKNNSGMLRIGVASYTLASYFNGDIDEVRVWNKILTPQEILDSYNNGLNHQISNVSTTQLVGYWPFDKYGEDDSGNRLNGSITGGRITGRSSVREFPQRVGLISTNKGLDIIQFSNEGDAENTLWMRFWDTSTNNLVSYGPDAAVAKNGIIYMGSSTDGLYAHSVDFITENGTRWYTSAYQRYNGNISARNDAKSFTTISGWPLIPNNEVKDVYLRVIQKQTNNIALNGTASANSTSSASYNAANIIDGRVYDSHASINGRYSYWMSVNYVHDAQVTLDLGYIANITKIKFKNIHASTSYNRATKDYRIAISNTSDFSSEIILEDSNFTTSSTVVPRTPRFRTIEFSNSRPARYVRFYMDEYVGSYSGGLAELEVYDENTFYENITVVAYAHDAGVTVQVGNLTNAYDDAVTGGADSVYIDENGNLFYNDGTATNNNLKIAYDVVDIIDYDFAEYNSTNLSGLCQDMSGDQDELFVATSTKLIAYNTTSIDVNRNFPVTRTFAASGAQYNIYSGASSDTEAVDIASDGTTLFVGTNGDGVTQINLINNTRTTNFNTTTDPPIIGNSVTSLDENLFDLLVGVTGGATLLEPGEPNMPCGSNIANSFVLNIPISGDEDCWNVTGDNLTIDCGGNTLTGPDTNWTGIKIFDRTNVTVKNCKIEKFAYGIYINNSNVSIIRNNTLDANDYGLYLENGYNSTIYWNNFTNSNLMHAHQNVTNGNSFNTTNSSGTPQGNEWDDVPNIRLYDNFPDGNYDRFGDDGDDYPYNATNNANVTGFIFDWGPMNAPQEFSCLGQNYNVINEDIMLNSSLYCNNLTIDNATVIANSSANSDQTISIGAKFNLTILSNVTITADGTGYSGGAVQTAGSGPGGGQYSAEGTYSGGGGGHGGKGGAGSGAGGVAHDSSLLPNEPGSGGAGGDDKVGGAGGGSIKIYSKNGTLTLNGNITAIGNAGASGTYAGGGGAGGTIFINATKGLSGTIILNVSGGNSGGASAGGGGAGGRIAVRYNGSHSLTVTPYLSGGTGQNRGENGTFAFIDYLNNYLLIEEGFRFQSNDGFTTKIYDVINMTNADKGVIINESGLQINATDEINIINSTIRTDGSFKIVLDTNNLSINNRSVMNVSAIEIYYNDTYSDYAAYDPNIALNITRINISSLIYFSLLNGDVGNISSNIILGTDNVFVNSSGQNAFNRSANITILGKNFTNVQILADYTDTDTFSECSSAICTLLVNTSGKYVFNVTRFTTYKIREFQIDVIPDRTLILSDDTDTLTKYPGDNINFYANYTDSTGGPVATTNDTCFIQFDVNTYRDKDKFRVDNAPNTTTHKNLTVDSKIAINNNGSYAVVWLDSRANSGTDTAIYGRTYNSSDNALISDTEISWSSGINVSSPDIDHDHNYSFIIVWQDRYSDSLGDMESWIYARKMDEFGNLGTTFRVDNRTGYGNKANPQIAVSTNDSFMVAWTENVDGYVKLFNSSLDNTTVDISTGNIVPYDVAANEHGKFMILSESPVIAKIFNSTGTTITGNITVDASTYAVHPSITTTSNGSFAIAYTTTDSGGVPKNITVKIFNDTTGARDKSYTAINADGYDHPKIGVDMYDHVVLVAAKNSSGTQQDIKVKKFDDSGNQIYAIIDIDQDPATGNQHKLPDVGIDNENDAIVTWQGNQTGFEYNSTTDAFEIYARRFDYYDSFTNMTYNDTQKIHKYGRSFNVMGTFYFGVNCTNASNVVHSLFDVDPFTVSPDCGDITTNVTLSVNITTAGTCFNFISDNVKLDCAGHIITGSTMGFGVNATGRTGIIVENCTFRNFSVGILYNDTNTSIIRETYSYNNTNHGILLDSASGNIIYNNTLRNNTVAGLKLFDSSNSNNIYNIIMSENSKYGLYIENSGTITLQNSTSASNTYGFFAESCDNSNFQNLIISSNTYGIFAESCDNNNFQNLTISSNTYGMDLNNSDTNIIDSSHIYANTYGLRLYAGSSNNNASNNIIENNTYSGVELFSLAFGNNVSTGEITNNTMFGVIISNASNNTVYLSNITNTTVAGIYINQSAENNTICNNTIQYNPTGLAITGGSNNIVYFNKFLNSSISHANQTVLNGNSFNTTNASGIAMGNEWGDNITLLEIYDTRRIATFGRFDNFGDFGSEYPFNVTNRGFVSGYVNDWGPVTNKKTYSLLSCNLYSGGSCPSGLTDVLHMSDIEDAHAELPNQSNYGFVVCCNESRGFTTITNTSTKGFNFLDLSNYTNAHVELPTQTNYNVEAYIGADEGNISCIYPQTYGSCPYNFSCLATVSQAISGASNMHIANCSGANVYDTTVCCGFLEEPLISFVNPNSGEQNATYLLVNVTGIFTYFTTITDNSNVTFGSGITIHNISVNSDTELTANISIGQYTTVGTRNITVNFTDSQGTADSATLENGFTVTDVIFCGDNLTSGSWTMDRNITDISGLQCLGMISDNAILDCNSYFIFGSDYLGVGVNVTNRTNITVHNCTIEMFQHAIYLDLNTSNSSFIDNKMFNNTVGINITNGTENFIYYNNFSSNIAYQAVALISGNSFNTTSSSNISQGNYWSDVPSLQIFDLNSDTYGDNGNQYPYNSSNGGNVNGYVNDWGPQPPRQPTCGDTITFDYTLTEDINTSGDCLEIDADNVVFDCAGYTITGPGSGNGVKIVNNSNITIKYCTITLFDNAILANDITVDSLFYNNTMYDNKIGVNLSNGSTNNKVYWSNFTSSTYYHAYADVTGNFWNTSDATTGQAQGNFWEGIRYMDIYDPALNFTYGTIGNHLPYNSSHGGNVSQYVNDYAPELCQYVNIATSENIIQNFTCKVIDISTGVTFGILGNFSNTIVSDDTASPLSGPAIIRTKDITVYAGATINADEQGWIGGNATKNGTGPGRGMWVQAPAAGYGGAGASHGGFGGQRKTSATSIQGKPGPYYGSSLRPMTFGSGGAGGGTSTASAGGAGGGVVFINASGIFVLNGTITADGKQGGYASNEAGGGGSGGSIFLEANTLEGIGTLSARGGNGGATGISGRGGAGAGGGRIAIHVISFKSGFGRENLTVDLSRGLSVDTGSAAQNGTSGTYAVLVDNRDIFIDDASFIFERQDESGPRVWHYRYFNFTNTTIYLNTSVELNSTLIYFEDTEIISINSSPYNVDYFAFGNIGENEEENLTLKLSTNVTYGFHENQTYFINIVNTKIHGVKAVNITSTNMTCFDGSNVYDTMYVNMISLDVFIDNSNISNNQSNATGYLKFNATRMVVRSNSEIRGNTNITVVNLTIDSTSSINATGSGYAGGAQVQSGSGPGAGTYSSNYGGGAGHGGAGGRGLGSGSAGGVFYGSSFEPITMGSGGGGGGTANDVGGDGGGAIKIIASDTFTLDGSVASDGIDGYSDIGSNKPGGGAGGSIWIIANNLTGNGNFSAKGGEAGHDTNTDADGGGGGGGRIAVYYNTTTWTISDFIKSRIPGGIADTSSVDGELGTLAFIDEDDDTFFTTEGFRWQQNDFDTNAQWFNWTNLTDYRALVRANKTIVKLNVSEVFNSTHSIWNFSNVGNYTLDPDNVYFTNTTLYCGNYTTLTGDNITIDENSSINATGSGYAGGAQVQNGS